MFANVGGIGIFIGCFGYIAKYDAAFADGEFFYGTTGTNGERFLGWPTTVIKAHFLIRNWHIYCIDPGSTTYVVD